MVACLLFRRNSQPIEVEIMKVAMDLATARKKKRIKARNRFEGFLPDGFITNSVDKYTKAWREFAQPFVEEFGWLPHGYEPGISFWIGLGSGPVSQGTAGKVFHMDLSLARKFRDLIVEARALRKKVKA
jgi:hypothetical protein